MNAWLIIGVAMIALGIGMRGRRVRQAGQTGNENEDKTNEETKD